MSRRWPADSVSTVSRRTSARPGVAPPVVLAAVLAPIIRGSTFVRQVLDLSEFTRAGPPLQAARFCLTTRLTRRLTSQQPVQHRGLCKADATPTRQRAGRGPQVIRQCAVAGGRGRRRTSPEPSLEDQASKISGVRPQGLMPALRQLSLVMSSPLSAFPALPQPRLRAGLARSCAAPAPAAASPARRTHAPTLQA